jgi:serine phosphatase RsbU (regulator of sigma subunit)
VTPAAETSETCMAAPPTADDSEIQIAGLPAFARRPPEDTLHEPRFHAVSRPASALTGDFYLRLRRGDGWLFGLGDVAGHGLEASVYMMMIQEEVERLAGDESLALPALVSQVHATMRRELPGSRFASLVLAELLPGGRMELVNAGHCPPLLRRGGGEVIALPPNGPILGSLPQSRWSSLSTRLRRGDTLLLVSDGVLEAPSPAGEEFGAERLWDAFRRYGALAVPDLVLRLLDQVAHFRSGPPADDTTVVAIRA